MHDRICPQCCGEQREITLDCPSECSYLQQARQHDKPRSLEQIPAEELFPKIDISEEFLQNHEPLLVGVSNVVARVSYADRALTDREVIGALVILAKSYQTLIGSGLVYQEALPNLAQTVLIGELNKLVSEFEELEEKHLGYTSLKDGDVLKMLVFFIRLGQSRTSGRPRSRAFLDFLKAQFPEARQGIAATAEAESRIILP